MMEYTKLRRENILAHFPNWEKPELHCFDSIGSTNTYAKELAAQGAPHGTVIVADHQTGGRGRMGRSFHSPEGQGIYLSVLLRPACKPEALMHLTCAAAVAMCSAVEAACGITPGIKWTNDLVVGRRKLGGILTELSVDTKTGLVSYAVVGVGINCSQSAGDFPPEIARIATSLRQETGRDVDRNALAAAMVRALLTMALFSKEAMLDSYRKNCITLGQPVSIVRGDELRYGTALDIDSDGGLVVRLSDGAVHTVSSGEVSVRGMYGYI